jgi:hypothetical protein
VNPIQLAWHCFLFYSETSLPNAINASIYHVYEYEKAYAMHAKNDL